MSSSESDEFESADEDLDKINSGKINKTDKTGKIEEKHEENKNIVTEDKGNVIRKTSKEIQENILEAINDENQLTKSTTSPTQIDVIKKPNEIDVKKVENKNDSQSQSQSQPELTLKEVGENIKEQDKKNEQSEDKPRQIRRIERPNRDNKPKPTKLGMKLDSKSENTQTKEGKEPPAVQGDLQDTTNSRKVYKTGYAPAPARVDCWEAQDWEVAQSKTQEIDNKNLGTESIETKSSSNIDRDGWDSDDWEQPSQSDVEALPLKDTKSDQNLYNVFPVLGEISSETDTKNSGILGNLSKFISTSSSPKVRLSTFDTFPVLNEIDSKKSDSIASSENFQVAGDKKEISSSEETKEKLSGVFDKLSKDSENFNSWGWKPWGGFSSLISTATEGVATLTSHVSHGISTVIESGMNVPDPEHMAKLHQEENKKKKEAEAQNPDRSDTNENITKKTEEKSLILGNLVSGVTQISNKVISGGLDTLEGIGKKTMTILQEGDPGLMNKRKLLGLDNEKPVLSQILREAKEKTEEAERNLKQMQKHMYKKQLHFETLFDDYCGLVHLEALEMLSKQSAIKLQSLLAPLTGKALVELQETMNEVKELCELPDHENEDSDGNHTVEELTEKLKAAIEDLGIPVDFKELLICWRENTEWLQNNEIAKTTQEIHDKALHCLAQTTALGVNRMHKLAEMLLIQDHHSTANEADSLVQLTTALCGHLSGIAAKFGGMLSLLESSSEETNALITSIFLEGSNSTSYIQNAFQLFIPILQIGAA